MVSLALSVVLDVVLIPPFGASGAAVAATAGLLAGGITSLLLYRRVAQFSASALLVPERRDLDLLRALARPLARSR
jgi:O-antigen/teichoic acid export membrane protein